MTSIFSRIFPYRQSEGRTPCEDFFTETFVYVVSESELFKHKFVMWLFNQMLELENIRIEIETYRRFGRLCPDICVEVQDTDNNRYVAIIESKIDSCQRNNQLQDYDNILVQNWQNYLSKTLVYITKYNEDVSDYNKSNNIEFRPHQWSDLYKMFAEAEQENPEEVGALEHELLKLMEDWQMNGSIDPIHLRSFITCFENEVGEKLAKIQDDALIASGLVNDLKMADKRIRKKLYLGEQYTRTIQRYGVRIWMGFRYDRREPPVGC